MMAAASRPGSGGMRPAGVWRRIGLRARLCAVVIGLYGALALWGECAHRRHRRDDQTPPYQRVRLEARNRPPLSRVAAEDGSPGGLFLLGTDNLGRDILTRLVQGARIAFHVGVVTSLMAVPTGLFLGLLAGYFGRRLDALLCALAASVAAVPSILLILAIATLVGRGLLGLYLGIGLTTWVGVFRTVRGETLKHRRQGYVQSARALGFGPARIIGRHLLPNVAHLAIVAFSIRFPAAVSTEVFLSFLGVGVQGEPSWGVMIDNARTGFWIGNWWEGTFVTLAVFVLVLCFNLLGDALRDVLDPTLRGASDAA